MITTRALKYLGFVSKLHFYKYFGAFSVIFNLGTGSSVHLPPATKYGIYDSFVIIMSMKLTAYHNVCTVHREATDSSLHRDKDRVIMEQQHHKIYRELTPT